ncbi:hypothetical protein AB1I63_05325 [Streptococcus pneumoniae]
MEQRATQQETQLPKKFVNLTGHPINIYKIVDGKGCQVVSFPPSPVYNPLRLIGKIEDTVINKVPIKSMQFELENCDGVLKYLEEFNIIVSGHTAEALRKKGYKGKFFKSGKKYIENGKILGCLYLIEC